MIRLGTCHPYRPHALFKVKNRPGNEVPLMSHADQLLKIHGLDFSYSGTSFRLCLEEFGLDTGRTMALIGRSGCGKSTLLDLACGIRTPQKGTVEFEGRDLAGIGDEARRLLRLDSVGLVFQEFRLLDYLTVLDSILLPIRLSGRPVTSEIRERAHELARRAGIQDLLKRRPQRLSQGERQRAAICRALIGTPRLVLADEPTGNLDPATAESVLDLLFEQVAEAEAALLVITHDHEILPRFDEVFDLSERNLAGTKTKAGAR